MPAGHRRHPGLRDLGGRLRDQYRITVAGGHGFSTGQEVIYTGESLPLGGLVTGQHYFVDQDRQRHFALAKTKDDALAWTATNHKEIDLIDNGIASDTHHVVQTLNNTGVPSINNQAFNDPSLTDNRNRKPLTATETGLIIVASASTT